MRAYDDLTPAMQAVLMMWTRGYTCWIGFVTDLEKIPALEAKWIESYGTTLSAEKRRWRRKKKLPVAWAASMPVVGNPYKRQIILMATPEALTAPPHSPFAREKWLTRPPEVADYVMVREPRDRGDYSWTWRIQNRPLGLIEQHLIALVKQGRQEAPDYADKLVRFHPMFGGVRRQIRRLLRSAAKLWKATQKCDWPGPDPEALPFVRFRKL